MNGATHEIAIVGAGPRGTSVIERICANARAEPAHGRVLVHVIDSAAPGAGSVWRAEQARQLLTNTVASQITVYTDVASQIDGPIEPGPSLYEWAVAIAADESSRHDEATLAEARSLGPDSYPTRAFCGSYFADCFRRVRESAPAGVEIRVHNSRAVAIADTHGFAGGPQGIRLADGTRLNHLDAIVLAQGHLPTSPTPVEARTASMARIHGLTYLTPANPADVDLSAVPAGEPVLLRGLGLCFFDYLTLLTAGRGGRFERVGDRLVYRPSGNEPRMYAGSRRGIPHQARGENQKGAHGRHLPRLLTPDRIRELRTKTPVSFLEHVWPLVALEVEAVYYQTLLAQRGKREAGVELADRYLGGRDAEARADVLTEFGVEKAARWDWESLSDGPQRRTFTGREDFREWLIGYLDEDLKQARLGNVAGPLKAALDVLRDLRNEIRLVVDEGGLDGGSHRDELERWYTPLNAFLSIGPPPRRIEEMIALIQAGVLDLTGPRTRIRLDAGTRYFEADSPLVPGPPVRSRVLIEARLPEPDLRRSADPLVRHLLETEACTTFRIRSADGGEYETGGLAVTARPCRIVDAAGRAHPRRFAYGVPTESVHWVTAAGIRPGVDSVTLADADAIARAVLALAPSEEALGVSADEYGVEVIV